MCSMFFVSYYQLDAKTIFACNEMHLFSGVIAQLCCVSFMSVSTIV